MYRLLAWTSKGGTGKTTTVANIGVELARRGKRVLLIDFDPQADLSATFAAEVDDEGGIEGVLANGGDVASAEITVDVPASAGRLRRRGKRAKGSLRLLPCSLELARLGDAFVRDEYRALDRLLGSVEDVDVVLIDTQGALTQVSHTAVSAADGVMFCGEPGFYELRALMARREELDGLAAERGRGIDEVGVLFVRTNERSRQLREYRTYLESDDGGSPLFVFPTFVRQQTSVKDDPRLGVPTVIADPRSHVAADYRAVTEELVERLDALGGDLGR